MSYEIYEKLKIITQKVFKNLWVIFILGFFVILVLVTILPSLAEMYASQVHIRADSSQMNLSRSEFLKILISLISPILSFWLLRNTIKIQDASLKRRNIDDVNRDFYGLIDIFGKQQTEVRDRISEFHENVIIKDGLKDRFNDGYKFLSSGIEQNLYSYRVFSKATKNWNNKFILNERRLIEDRNYRVTYIINDQFNSVYYELSSYFKVLHRIIKSLNKKLEEEIIDDELYLDYIGLLRAQISSEELVMILVNSLYTYRGLGLGVELVGTDFFGDKRDFELEQHFEFPAPQITNEHIGLFVYDKEGKMMDKRIKLRKALKNNTSTSDLQLSSSKSNFKKFSKENNEA